jgi:HAD superfamily hydrolase (TIGR01509 family)
MFASDKMNMKTNTAKGYIFDLDGTLFDSTGVWMQIDIDFLKSRNLPADVDYARVVTTMTFTEAAQYTIDLYGLPDKPEDLYKQWFDAAMYAYGHTIGLKPYALEYLQVLKSRGAKIGIATSSVSLLYKKALEHLRITDLFDAITESDEVGHGKENPDVYLLAARKLGARPEDCVVFEDALQAIKSAKAGGMTVYGILDEMSKEDWCEIRATADGVMYDFKDAPLP